MRSSVHSVQSEFRIVHSSNLTLIHEAIHRVLDLTKLGLLLAQAIIGKLRRLGLRRQRLFMQLLVFYPVKQL